MVQTQRLEPGPDVGRLEIVSARLGARHALAAICTAW
jgi:hypothetical protein